jgi:hypothetical protein
MYVARFSYTIRPVDRDPLLNLHQRQVEAAQVSGLEARLLIPLTRAPGGAALQIEVVVSSLDTLYAFREAGMGVRPAYGPGLAN